MDPSIDFAALYKEFDTLIMGRKTYEVAAQAGSGEMPGMEVVVFSRTLPPTVRKGLRIVADDPAEVVKQLKSKPGRDIWLFGGGTLFRTLLDAGLVDTVEVGVMPVLLGSGIPLLPPGASSKLVLVDQKVLPASGIVALSYLVHGKRGPGVRVRYIKPAKRQRKRVSKKRAPAKANARTGRRKSRGA
jgi:dihydrofolate reductase